MREAICALAEIEILTVAPEAQSRVLDIIRTVMKDDPGSWKDYYAGTPAEQDVLLFNSYSDRIRYYWPDPKIEAAMARLVSNLTTTPPPEIFCSAAICPRSIGAFAPASWRAIRRP